MYLSGFQDDFKTATKTNFAKAEIYIEGLIQSNLKNIERISENLDANYHQMQHFITNSNWDYRQVIDKVASQVSECLPKRKLTGLIIDESGWLKKGDKSVGVGYQYCGNVGKTANCQVAVFGCLSNGQYASMIDSRLYLPKDWCDDEQRCNEAGIPQDKQEFKTKLGIALEIIRHQVKKRVLFDYISADGYYGNDAGFAREIDTMNLVYMLDIHSDQKIYLEKPELYLPERKNKKGPTPKRLKATTKETSVSEYMQTLSDKDWQIISIRDSVKGVLRGKFHFRKVYVWDKQVQEVENRLLIIRQTKTKKGSAEIKYSFTNANQAQYSEEGLAYMQAQRFFVEHSIKEAKQILGLDHFQTRMWTSWNHQVALNMMVGCFILKEKLYNKDQIPLLSARDIMDFMIFKLFRSLTDQQMLDLMKERHRLRQKDISYCYSKQIMC